MLPELKGRMGHDIGDFIDSIWANAASQHRAGALRAEPLRVSGKAAHRISQDKEGQQ